MEFMGDVLLWVHRISRAVERTDLDLIFIQQRHKFIKRIVIIQQDIRVSVGSALIPTGAQFHCVDVLGGQIFQCVFKAPI